MDENDMKILEIMEKDARIPLADMATMLSLDEKEIEKRIKKLQKRKIIRKFKTSINNINRFTFM